MADRWLEAARTGDIQRDLVDNLPLPVFIHDSVHIVYVNEACVRLTGATEASELVGKSVFSFVHPDGVPAAEERVRLVFERDLHIANAEVKLAMPDGSVLKCMVAGFPVKIFGRDLVAGVITEHERPERNNR